MRAYNIDTALEYKAQVTELYIHNRPFQDIASIVTHCPNLKVLELHNNQFDETKEIDLSTLPLVALRISQNNLPTPPLLPQSIELLDLSLNNLKRVSGLHYYKQLTTISLAKNNITTIPKFWEQLITLKALDLSHNNIKAIPTVLRKLPQLQDLNLSHNRIQKIEGLQFIYHQLKQLNLSFNKLLTVHLALPFSIDSLELNNNKITSCEIEFDDTTVLEKVNLSHNKLTQVPHWIYRCKWLKYLRINNNKITRLNVDGLAKSLQLLALQNNQLSTLYCTSRLPRLHTLTLTRNKLTEISPLLIANQYLTKLNGLPKQQFRLTAPQIIRWNTYAKRQQLSIEATVFGLLLCSTLPIQPINLPLKDIDGLRTAPIRIIQQTAKKVFQ